MGAAQEEIFGPILSFKSFCKHPLHGQRIESLPKRALSFPIGEPTRWIGQRGFIAFSAVFAGQAALKGSERLLMSYFQLRFAQLAR